MGYEWRSKGPPHFPEKARYLRDKTACGKDQELCSATALGLSLTSFHSVTWDAHFSNLYFNFLLCKNGDDNST